MVSDQIDRQIAESCTNHFFHHQQSPESPELILLDIEPQILMMGWDEMKLWLGRPHLQLAICNIESKFDLKHCTALHSLGWLAAGTAGTMAEPRLSHGTGCLLAAAS